VETLKGDAEENISKLKALELKQATMKNVTDKSTSKNRKSKEKSPAKASLDINAE